MDIDGNGGRREFGLRGQRRGTESIVAEMVERCEDGGDRLVLLSLRAARGKDPSENRKEQCI
jgi:hypothetical protein